MIDSVNVQVIWEKGAYDKITKEIPDKIVHDIARITLDMTTPTIPERTGKMKRSTLARGVQGGNSNYKIGSYTDYAAYVYVMPEKTHWTTPGTNAYWFREVVQKNIHNIMEQAVERNKLK